MKLPKEDEAQTDLIWEKYSLKNENKTDVMFYENFCDAVEEIQKAYATGLLQEIVDEMPVELPGADPYLLAHNDAAKQARQLILNKAKREQLEVKEKQVCH